MSTRKVDAGQKPFDIMACHVTGRSGRRRFKEGKDGFKRALATQCPAFGLVGCASQTL